MTRKPIAERLDAIEARLTAIERVTVPLTPLGPSPEQDSELERDRERMVEQIVEAARTPAQLKELADAAAYHEDHPFGEGPSIPPVDRSCQILTDGSPVPKDRSHTQDRGDGQQKGYVVLCDTERSKGFVRPYRDAYKHLKCGSVTTMGRKIAETYARDPYFYSGTFCCKCGAHFPVGEHGEFIWATDGTPVGA